MIRRLIQLEVHNMSTVKTSELETDAPAEFGGWLDAVTSKEVKNFLKFVIMAGGNEDEPLTMRDLTYEIRLWPYLNRVAYLVSGQPGVAGRILQIERTITMAENTMEAETGLKRRIPRTLNLPAILAQYFGEGLPVWDVTPPAA